MDSVFEIVLYQIKPGVERNHLLAASAQAADWLRTRSGYLGRELLEDESGQWIDLVHWATMDDALTAAAAFGETDVAAAFMNTVDPESIRMMHPRTVATYD